MGDVFTLWVWHCHLEACSVAISGAVRKERNDRSFKEVSMSVEVLMSKVIYRIAKSASLRKEFDSLGLDGLLRNWEATLSCGPHKVRKVLSWPSPASGVLKFNEDGATSGKPSQSQRV